MRNFQFLDVRDAFFVAGAGRGQPYGFRFCESFAQFAVFGRARCIFRGRRRTRPTLWFQILRKLRTICIFWSCEMHFSWQAQDAANLMVIFRGRRSTRAQIVRLDSRKKKLIYNYFLRDSNLMICNFSCVFSAKVTVRLDFRGRCSTLWLSCCFCVAGPRHQNRKVGFSCQVP